MVAVSPQPHVGALMRAQTRQNIAVDSSRMPGCRRSAARSRAVIEQDHRPMSSATTPTGTLMKKTDCQLTCSTSRPPTIGPAAVEAPMTAPQMPMAMFSFSAGKAPQQAEGGRHQQRAEQALKHAEVPTSGERRQADGAGGGGEADDAHQEGLAVAEPVAELAGGDQGDGESEQISVGDPLDIGE